MKEIFDLEESRLRNEITGRGSKRVLIQLPEGLKTESLRLASIVENAGALAIVSADPCYGACDLSLSEAESLEADLVIHYGHAEMPMKREPSVPVVYIEARVDIDVKIAVEEAVDQLKTWSSVGLATTVQHVHMLNEAKQILNNAGKTVYIGDAGRVKYPGQVIGCDYSNAKSISDHVEAFLFVGGGRFHAFGLFLATMKPTIVADPFEKRAYSIEVDSQKIIRKRWSDICEARGSKNFGIIIGLKTGQSNIETALKIKEDLEKSGKKTALLALREVTPMALLQFPAIEAYVNTACPRIALDEPSVFKKPVLTVKETHVLLDKIKWEDILKDGII